MKQLNLVGLFFYFFAVHYFFTLQATEQEQSTYAFTVLQSIKKAQHDIEDYMHEFEDEEYDGREQEKNFIDEILVILIGTYQKIVTATVTYYLMMNLIVEYDLHQAIAAILVEDITKIIKIIGREIIRFVMSPTINYTKKLWYSFGVIISIVSIRLWVYTIPKAENSSLEILNNSGLENKISVEKSGYLSDKFGDWR